MQFLGLFQGYNDLSKGSKGIICIIYAAQVVEYAFGSRNKSFEILDFQPPVV